MEFKYEKDWFVLKSDKCMNEYETVIYISDVKSAVIRSKGCLLDPAHRRKVERELSTYFAKDVKYEVMQEILRAYDDWEVNKDSSNEIIITSPEAFKILDNDPKSFLIDELHKIHPGDNLGLSLYIYSLMSLHGAIKYLVHVEALGKSGAGKSHGQKVCKLMLPMYMQHSIDTMSAKSLIYYAKDHSLKNKLIIIDDATEKDVEMLKHVGNNGLEPFTYSSVIDGVLVEFKADASPLLWFSKVSPLEDEGGQVASRFLVFNVDEGMEQRYNILGMIERDEEVEMSPLCKEIINECMQLKVEKVDCGDLDIPDKNTIGFRDANFFKALVKSSALLNHRNRVLTNGVLYCNDDDRKNVNKLWKELLKYNRHKLSKKYAMVYDLIPETIDGISSTKLRELSGMPRTSLQKVLDSLEQKELIKKMVIGKTGYYYRE